MATYAENGGIVTREDMKSFVKRCLQKVGAKDAHADVMAELLCLADDRGHYSHGLNRLDHYVDGMKTGVIANDAEPEIIRETVSTAYVDGKNLLGGVVGKFCNELAIKKAKETGIAIVNATHSNHFGIVGWYTMKAMEQGLIGMAFTNTSPLMYTTRGTQPMLGTNPISFAAAGTNGDSFVLDMATTSVAQGKMEMAARTGAKMPDGWACDDKGRPTNDPNEALKEGGGLLPLGGAEESSGYKGYGLGMMVEVLCGILGGGGFGPNIRVFRNNDRPADYCHCFIAINPECFGPGSSDRLQTLMNTLRSCPPVEEDKPVLVAGDPERAHMKHCDDIGGIPYHKNQIEFANQMAKRLEVAPMKVKLV